MIAIYPCSHYFPYYTYYYLLAISRGRSIRFLICKEICRPSSVKLQTHLKTAKCAYLRALQTFPLPPWSKHCFEKHSRLLIRKKFNVVKYQIVILDQCYIAKVYYDIEYLLLSLCCWDVSLLQTGSPCAAKSLNLR